MVKIPSIEEMLKAGMHFGHQTSKWHPKMEPFIFGKRANVHIINLEKTQQLLEEALQFISRMAAENKTILLVGTKDQVKSKIASQAEELGIPYVSNRWLGGTLTNFAVIKRLVKNYLDLKEKREAGKLGKYTKKEQLDFTKKIEKLERMVGGLVNLKKLPDVIFIWDIKREKTAFNEARKKGVPIIAICDTNVNPDGIKYVIPCNDDATKAAKLVLQLVSEAVKEGRAAGMRKPEATSAKDEGQGVKK
ncbi:30S ribosomal protein S2 [Candidatus Falkowbacteria bacterium CG10_big_fil_rev_8_21_14_0_10_43_10]|uniref:Small ribosomal subunit protein uS2 n=1 Tax=Candidatus Falkowbacteria bacterium CG10_big_fil_rev_8_21_14_0_10_43_10 TaxID=1974567 RepID=A0A2H0V2K1_9BACT|nr:MAG: 30S ribosomal protein S2 [Candidatus Falkowbacteria bacterium CG10_big_fil_rev_8_21_14_0_10_43_10]